MTEYYPRAVQKQIQSRSSTNKNSLLFFHIDWERCYIFLHVQNFSVINRIFHKILILILFSAPCIENCIKFFGMPIQFGCRKIDEHIKKRLCLFYLLSLKNNVFKTEHSTDFSGYVENYAFSITPRTF